MSDKPLKKVVVVRSRDRPKTDLMADGGWRLLQQQRNTQQ